MYRCKDDAHLAMFCGLPGFQPGAAGDFWTMAWEAVGHCDEGADATPTGSPAYVSLEPLGGGCPDAWSPNGRYGEGERVSRNGVVFSCKVR